MHKALVLLLAVAALACGEEVKIKLSATDLHNCDATSKCDLVVEIYCMHSMSDWTKCGETKEISNDNFPVFPEIFTFEYTVGARDKWQFVLIDKDVALNDKLDSQELSVETFIEGTKTQRLYPIALEGKVPGAKLYVENYTQL